MGYIFTILTTFWNTVVSGVAMHLVFSVSGIFFLGLPTVSKVSAYTLAILEKNGVDPITAFFIATAVSVTVGVAFAFISLRVNTESLAAISIGSILATEAVLQSWDSFTGGVLGISGIARPEMMSSLTSVMVGSTIL